LYPNWILTSADPESQAVTISVPGDEMYALTPMVSVGFGHQKLPLYLLATGETVRCEATQLGELDEDVSDDSLSGYMTREIMIPYLGWLHASLDDRNGTSGSLTF
jgi:hypothetical protein